MVYFDKSDLGFGWKVAKLSANSFTSLKEVSNGCTTNELVNISEKFLSLSNDIQVLLRGVYSF